MVDGLDSNSRLNPPLNPLGADTGRFSYKKPNLMAIPRNSEIRGCFIPEDGLVLIEADFSNIEMRVAAWFAGEERMLAVFRNEGDIHGETAALILGDRQARQPAKPINFGCLYGGGAERLRITARTKHGIEFSADQARQYDRFFTSYSGLRSWHQSAKSSAAGLTYGPPRMAEGAGRTRKTSRTRGIGTASSSQPISRSKAPAPTPSPRTR